MKRRLDKRLADIEKRFNEDKYFKNDPNRDFIMNWSKLFLKAVASEASAEQEESKSSDHSMLAPRAAK